MMTAEQQKEFLNNLGIDVEKVDTIEAATELISSQFIKREQAVNDETIISKIVGSRLGKIETAAKQTFKALGAEFEPDEIKGKKVEELLSLGESKVKSSWEAKQAELEKLASSSEGAKQWEDKYTKLEHKFKEVNGLKDSLKQQFDELIEGNKTKERTTKIESWKSSQIKDAKLRTDLDELTLTGFNVIMDSKYAFDLDENGIPFVKDKNTGTRIQSKKKPADFADFAEIFEMEARDKKLWSDSPHSGKPNQGTQPRQQRQEPPADTTLQKVSSRAMQLAARG